MTFKEDFPSLVKVECFTLHYYGNEPEWVITQDAVQKHCLDKQRVKEAIEKVRKKALGHGSDYLVSLDNLEEEFDL